MKIFTAAFCLIASFPALASAHDACDDLWFVRNLVFAKQGYCFGSPLGQAVFGTASCTTKSPTLSAQDKAIIAQTRTMEKRWECKVNSNKTRLDVHSLALRWQLRDQPLHDDTESSCITYVGPKTPLYAGHSTSDQIIGYIYPGDDFGNAYVSFSPDTNWLFISAVSAADGTLRPDIGWTQQNLWENCTHMAG